MHPQAGLHAGRRRRPVVSDELGRVVQIYADQLVHEQSGSVMKPLSSDADLRQGLNPSLVIFDEVHVQPNDDLWTAYDEAMGARERPLLLGITTPGRDLEGFAYSLYEYGKAEDDPDFYFKVFEPSDPGCAIDDEAAWAEANPGLNDWLSIEDMRSKCQRAVKLEREPTFRRFSMGMWTEESESWIPRGVWDACADSSIAIETPPRWCSPPTAASARTRRPLWRARSPRSRTSRSSGVGKTRTPATRRGEFQCKRWNVLDVTADPYRWQRTLAVLQEERITTSEYPQSPSRMTPSTSSLYEAVVNGQVTHDGDARLARHVANAVLKADSRGTRLVKEHKDSKRRIDLAVAAVMAHDRARALASRPKAAIYLLD
jgi:phage terminase large subunit-like protein